MQVATGSIPPAASLNEFPEEVLLAIFRHLRFRSILPLSMVCHRWNRLIFDSCSSQLVFRPRQWDQLCADRTYRHLDLSFCGLPVPSKEAEDSQSQLEELASRATSLRMSGGTEPWFAEQLVRVLRNFQQLEELRWECSGEMRDVWMKEDRFREELEGALPKIRVLSLVLNDTRMIDLLEKLSENVESLEIRLEIGPMLTALTFADFELSKLRTFKLMVTGARLDEDDKQAANDLHLLVKRIPNLRKLTVGIDNCFCQSAISSSGARIQELELIDCQECDLGHLRSLPCLVTFRTDAPAVFTDTDTMNLFNPIRTVTTIDLDRTLHVDIDRLALMFPHLRVLRVRSFADGWTRQKLHNLFAILGDLEELAIPAGPDLATLQEVLNQIAENLSEIRDLTLVGCVLQTPDFRLFGPILTKPTLRKLTIESATVRASAIPPAMYVLPAWNAAQTELVINGMRAQTVAGF